MVCDICGNRDRVAKRWVVTGPDAQRSLDLCDEHAEPLAAFFDQVEPKRRDLGDLYRRLTMEEIEAKKQSGQA